MITCSSLCRAILWQHEGSIVVVFTISAYVSIIACSHITVLEWPRLFIGGTRCR